MRKQKTASPKAFLSLSFRSFLEETQAWIHQSVRTSHGLLVLGGLFIGLCYFPAWLSYLAKRALEGAVSWFLITGMLCIGCHEVWRNRHQLKQMIAPEEDRLLGHILLVAAICLFWFCRFALWSQAIIWLMVLLGIAISTWGMTFFKRFPISAFFIALSVYPRLGIISRTVWDFLVPEKFLEKIMVFFSTSLLQIIGFSAEANGQFITLPKGAVEVGWGCNGLDMAITLAIAGLLIGMVFKLSKKQILLLTSTGVGLALVANIPRLMLVTIAYVYWGKDWFKFWHGFWGGQIFSGLLFTIYYYLFTGLLNRNTVRNHVN